MSHLAVLVKELVRDYELPEDMSVEINLNRFMEHIGLPTAAGLQNTC
jgi:hypothetical protein